LFSVPKVPGGLTSVVTTSAVTLSVSWGSIQSSLTTRFTYIPLVEGSAVIDSLYPQQLGSGTIGQIVYVKLSNFPKVLLTEKAKVLASFGGATDIEALSVLASSYTSTTAAFKINTTTTSSLVTKPLSVYHASFGPTQAGVTNVTILPPPSPWIVTYFPSRGQMGAAIPVAVTVQYFDPALTQPSWSVAMTIRDTFGVLTPVEATMLDGTRRNVSTLNLTVTSYQVLHASTCVKTQCSRGIVNFNIAVSQLPASLTDTGAQLTIFLKGGSSVVTIDPFYTIADNAPRFKAVVPTQLSLSRVGNDKVTLALRSVASTFCTTAATCVATFGGKPATWISATAIGKNLFVVVRPVAEGAAGIKACTLVSGADSFTFTMTYSLPDATASPIDGLCTGGTKITVTAVGWGVTATAASMTASIGGVNTVVGALVGTSTATPSASSTSVSLTVPALPQADRYTGVIASGGVSSSFNFECFNYPVMVVVPDQATTAGKTTLLVNGMYVTSFVISNFPSLSRYERCSCH
jgi:hypothetical protein